MNDDPCILTFCSRDQSLLPFLMFLVFKSHSKQHLDDLKMKQVDSLKNRLKLMCEKVTNTVTYYITVKPLSAMTANILNTKILLS